MRRVTRALLLIGIIQLIVPAAAHAGWGGIIDGWSGPGPFWFVDWEGRLLCVNDGSQGALASVDSKKENRVVAALKNDGCLDNPLVRPQAWINVRVAYMHNIKNDLQYLGDKPAVQVVAFEPSYTGVIGPKKFLQLSGGAGVMGIFVNGSSLSRFYVKPAEGTFYPFAGSASLWKRFGIGVGVIILPTGFDATDFGAKPGTFHTDIEVQRYVTVAWEFAR